MSDFPALPYPWQQDLWQSLLAQHQAGRLPHALMLAGPRGLGKRHLARALAQYLLCHGPVGEAACGKCKSCALNRAATHPDFILLEPEEAGKAIRIDDIRALAETQSKTAQLAGYKVAIVCPADAMNLNAANALLKTLEEPAAKTLLLLVSDVPGQVLPTVRSRCQLRSLKIPAREQSLRWLQPLLGGTGADANELLDLARGAPLAARDFLSGDALDDRKRWLADCGRLTLGQTDAIALAAAWQSANIPELMDWWIATLHTVTCWRVGAAPSALEKLDQAVRAQLGLLDLALTHRYLEKLLTAKKLLTSSANPNKQLMLEELLMDYEALLRASRGRSRQRA